MLKALFTHLILGRDEVLILDTDAGVEHLGRGTAQGVDSFIIVVEPGQRSLQNLLSAKGTPMTNKLIAFKELPGGGNYFRTFSKRAIEPLVEHFGEQPHLLIHAARKLGARRVACGDVAAVVNAFSRVPITILLWQGDEEFPSQGDTLFDAAISGYLSTYDITVLCESITWKLAKFLREGSNQLKAS